jgi:hypothetical protein
VDELAEALSGTDPEGLDFDAAIAQVTEMERELEAINAFLTEFDQIESRVLVTPFAGEVVSMT